MTEKQYEKILNLFDKGSEAYDFVSDLEYDLLEINDADELFSFFTDEVYNRYSEHIVGYKDAIEYLAKEDPSLLEVGDIIWSTYGSLDGKMLNSEFLANLLMTHRVYAQLTAKEEEIEKILKKKS